MVRRTPLVEYIGEISEGEKAEFLGNASALVFPIDWPEPFGLAMIKSMACRTLPVIAFRCGSVPEVVDPGLTGFIVEFDRGGGCSGGPPRRRSRSSPGPLYLREAFFGRADGG